MAEMGIVFWAAQLLVDQAGASPAAAAGALAAFTVGMTVGRWLIGPISVRHSTLGLLGLGSVVLVAGWATLWTTASLPVGVLALFVMGLGSGPCYPFAMTLALTHSPLGLDASQAILMVSGGLSGSLAPFALGWLGDRVGVHGAYVAIPWIVAGELLFAAAGWLALKSSGRRARASAR
jgi:fucose permease